MATRFLRARPFYDASDPTGTTLSAGARVTFYAPGDTSRTAPLQVLHPVTRAPMVYTVSNVGLGPAVLLSGTTLLDDDAFVQTVDEAGHVGTTDLTPTADELTSPAELEERVKSLATTQGLDALANQLGDKADKKALTDLATSIETELSQKADQDTLSDYVKTGALADYAKTSTLSDYVKTGALADYAKTSTLSDYATQKFVTDEIAKVPAGGGGGGGTQLIYPTEAEARAAAAVDGVERFWPVVSTGGGSSAPTTPPVVSGLTFPTMTAGTAIAPIKPTSTEPAAWSASGLPFGLAINAATGEITGTPVAATSGSAAVSAKGSGSGLTTTMTVSWTVRGTNKIYFTRSFVSNENPYTPKTETVGATTITPVIQGWNGKALTPLRTRATSGTDTVDVNGTPTNYTNGPGLYMPASASSNYSAEIVWKNLPADRVVQFTLNVAGMYPNVFIQAWQLTSTQWAGIHLQGSGKMAPQFEITGVVKGTETSTVPTVLGHTYELRQSWDATAGITTITLTDLDTNASCTRTGNKPLSTFVNTGFAWAFGTISRGDIGQLKIVAP